MLTKAGAKLMDFGLALETDLADPRASVTSGATMTRAPAAGQPVTAEGTLVGTLPYMAPEQLEGKDADARSDLWALGCVLYEMASGARAFDSKSKAGLIAAIIKEEPRPLPDLAPLSPLALAHVVGRCLAKDPVERWQSARDVARELGWISRGDSRVDAAGQGRAAKRRPVPWRRLSLAAGIAAIIAAALVLLPKGPPRLNPNMRTRIVDVPMSGISYPGLSQDGRWIALPARDGREVWGLYYMNASGGEVRPIAVDSSATVDYADISPDGSQVVYGVKLNSAAFEIRLVSVLGGAVRRLARFGVDPRWSPDGKRIGYLDLWIGPTGTRLGLSTMRPDGSDRTWAFVDSASTRWSRACFAWSPDGKRIAWLRSFENSTYNEIVIRDLASGRERQLTHDRKFIDEVVWTMQDEIVFSSNRGGASNLWIMRASGGRAAQVTRGAGPDLGVRVSIDGRTLLYLLQQPLERIGWWDVESGDRGRVTREDQPFGIPCLPSPDGRSIAIRVRDPDALTTAGALVIMSRDGSGRRTLVTSESAPEDFCWSPDGRHIAWASVSASRGDSMDVHVVDVATGEASANIALATSGKVRSVMWPTADTLLVHDEHGSFQYSFSTNLTSDRSPEQRFQYPTRGPGWIVISDRRQGLPHEGLYVRLAKGSADRLVMPGSWLCGDPTGKDFLYCWPESLGLSRMDLPSGRLTPVAHVPPEVRRGMLFYPTRDGRVVYWVEQREASKLVLVENLRQ